MNNKWLASTFCLALLAMSFSYAVSPVEGQSSQVRTIYITSPVENQTYQSHIVPLQLAINMSSFESVARMNKWANLELSMLCDLDGEPGYHAPKHNFGIGALEPPFPSSYSTTMDLASGNHTLWIDAFLWYTTPDGNHQLTETLSQFVNFYVAAPTANLSAINIEITCPLQDKIYQTNFIPLNFSCGTDVTGITLESFIFTLILDGQQGYHGGQGFYLGQSFSPFPSSYNSTMNLPNGNHSLWIDATVWVKDPYDRSLTSVYRLSQIVNFSVLAETNDTSTSVLPLQSSSVPELSWLITLPFLFALLPFAVFKLLKKQGELRKERWR
jgi:hypothetical protein